MKRIKRLTLLTLLMLANTAYLFADHLSASIQITARMNGNNEVPAVTTSAQGLGVFTMSINKQDVLVDIGLTDLSGPLTGIHIHDGVAGTNGPVAFDLSPFINGNRIQTTLTGLTTAQRAKFFDGSYYLNAHTAANPNGEIRAQLVHETDFRYTAYLKGSNEVPAVNTTALGWGSFNLSKAGYKLEINVSTDGLSGPITGAHLHMGAAGATGGVIEDLTPFVVGGSIINAVVDPSAYAADIAAGNVYINIHTAANPNGEIRDQLVLQPALHFDAFINSAQAGTSSAAFSLGTVNVDYNLSTITVHAIVDGLSGPITGAHIHDGTAGNAGPVVYDLGPLLNGNEIIGQLPLQGIASLNKFLSGGYYINIHTAAEPNGEIRGQIYKLSREGYVYDFSAENEVPPSNCMGTGVGMVTIDRDQSNAHYMMVVSDIGETVAAAHFHNAAAGMNGGVIFDLSPSFANFNNVAAYGYWTDQDPTTPFANANSVMFRNNEVYTNIHSANCPDGAIRGNSMRGRDIMIGSGEPIPTLSEWSLIILGLLVMIIGVVAIKSTVPTTRRESYS